MGPAPATGSPPGNIFRTTEMKQPRKTDFEVNDTGSELTVTFKPTESFYTFGRLDPSEWDRHGKISRDAKVRHATGYTNGYIQAEVHQMAYDLAIQHTRRGDA
jgi:hypothetical protein